MSKKLRLKLRNLFLIVIILLIQILAFVPATPARAISNPTAIQIHTNKVFQNIFTSGDIVAVVSEEVDYTSLPSESASTAFLFNILDVAGIGILASRGLNYYNYNLQAIYLTPAQVSGNITWGSNYKFRITGNPALFTSLVEGTNMRTTTLAGYDWITGDMTISRELLKQHLLDIAYALQTAWAITLLTTTSSGTQVINSTGRPYFIAAIPGIDNVIPDLFQTSIGIPSIDVSSTNITAAGANANNVTARLGSGIATAFTGIGNALGTSQQTSAGLWIALFILTVASIVFLNTENTTMAMILTVPIMLMGVYTGAIPMAILFTAGIVMVAYMGYFFWLRGM